MQELKFNIHSCVCVVSLRSLLKRFHQGRKVTPSICSKTGTPSTNKTTPSTQRNKEHPDKICSLTCVRSCLRVPTPSVTRRTTPDRSPFPKESYDSRTGGLWPPGSLTPGTVPPRDTRPRPPDDYDRSK